ncbi:DUF3343 domain-containing protein [Clostridium sp. SM-530-WT-3G]|uniref:DUF3343 domain-containing protein n=1 Tax=Clostridium sp. SM-530-WT-3G TaxID=2725303 RepID=UPI00145C8EB6|nr:DUF3343 domain-containing protein [Clostridium sp. SM-530-WT-3G]NME83638.1 DUF3343 domain-containing protein [Clostridium sp. SM-530-WT-3G]
MNYYIIVFKNTYDAMAAEKKLGELNVNFRIMPTPTTITMSCGICVRIEEEKSIKEIIDNKTIEFKNIYFRNKEGYIQIQ